MLALYQPVGPAVDWWDAYVELVKNPTSSTRMSSRWLSDLITYHKV
jgi:hypothetical protein